MKSRNYGGALLTVTLLTTVFRAGTTITSAQNSLDAYRSWKPLTSEALLVPYELAVQCAPITEQQLEKARKSHGPHTKRWIKVYANPLAAAAMDDTRAKVFPVGAVIAKEKLHAPDGFRADGVAFMIKHPKGQFVESDGWEFLYRPASPDKATYNGCIACHRAGGTKDYVFGRYGPI